MEGLGQWFEQVDRRVVAWFQRHSVPALRVALGIVFVWFGGLKVAGVSPVADLVATTVAWLPAGWFVPFLGVWEVTIGVGLLFRLFLRLTLLLLAAQLAGTFLVLLVRPDLAFAGSPLLLTLIGEFVVKNLVLLAAGMVLASTVRDEDETCLATGVRGSGARRR